MTRKEAVFYTREKLKASGDSEADSEAYLILELILGISRMDCLLDPQKELSDDDFCKLEDTLNRREKHEPLQYITGHQEFMGLDFMVSPAVLIPRQDTEILVLEAEKYIEEQRVLCNEDLDILDMCTGSGCIIISLKNRNREINATAVDISAMALEVAGKNAENNDAQVSFIHSDLFENVPIDKKFDLIVSNPPYIPSSVVDTLMPEVRVYEPRLALDGEADGLKFYKKIIRAAKEHLKPGGTIMFEMGFDQGESIERLFILEGYSDIYIVRDLAGLNRVICATLN